MIRSIAGLSGLALSVPAYLVCLCTAHVLFTLLVESVSSFSQSWKIGIHDFSRILTESALYRGAL